MFLLSASKCNFLASSSWLRVELLDSALIWDVKTSRSASLTYPKLGKDKVILFCFWCILLGFCLETTLFFDGEVFFVAFLDSSNFSFFSGGTGVPWLLCLARAATSLLMELLGPICCIVACIKFFLTLRVRDRFYSCRLWDTSYFYFAFVRLAIMSRPLYHVDYASLLTSI